MKPLIYLLFFVMLILHQDTWSWDDQSLVLGFLPIGLAYHAGFSICCAILGGLAIKHIWPQDLEKFADE
ncbi:MAG: hypothetical protein HN467_02120 [Opitutae bacterium]|jgi:hypothetical protein|nr:hypothetical protein [Opitutae bacterium]